MDSAGPDKQGVVAVVPRDGRLLVIRRSQFVIAPRAYCFPGGGIHDGEEESQALVREMREELGAEITPIQRIWRSQTPWDVEIAWWLAEIDGSTNFVPNEREVETVHWFSYDQLRSLAGLLESNQQFLNAWDRDAFQLP
jgi:8-oxo-dGTP pyrophosphatase MutT (NUDIX family)